MTAEDDKLAKALSTLTEQARGLRSDLEAWRVHSGSQGHFLQLAVEDLQKAVKELVEAALK